MTDTKTKIRYLSGINEMHGYGQTYSPYERAIKKSRRRSS